MHHILDIVVIICFGIYSSSKLHIYIYKENLTEFLSISQYWWPCLWNYHVAASHNHPAVVYVYSPPLCEHPEYHRPGILVWNMSVKSAQRGRRYTSGRDTFAGQTAAGICQKYMTNRRFKLVGWLNLTCGRNLFEKNWAVWYWHNSNIVLEQSNT